MTLTQEQKEIINSTGDIRINAVAGSGKTTTVIEYAKARPINSKVLYLVFNKSVKLEAIKKFAEQGVHNVHVETAHSLAFKHIVYKNGYKIKTNDYKANEIADLLKLTGNGEKHAEYIVANHIIKCISYFCNSEKSKVQEINYLNTISDPKAKIFVTTFYKYITTQARILLGKMNDGTIEITHDFYLKMFQLSNPDLNYDYILFDEGQDASTVMLNVFLNQKATKVIVGDTHQQIYAWRFAVNSLEKAEFNTYQLSTSFRFSQDIANLAMDILKFKKNINQKIKITGKGNSTDLKTKAVLARTNLGLLLKAIEISTENKKLQRIYFEGNINSYTYADEGASLYDVLNLYNNKRALIRDPLIKMMQNLNELEDYIKKTEDVQLGMMVEIVREYGNKIPGIIKKLKEKHVENNDRSTAEIIFSTVHRCKGMEYDSIQLVNDFITMEKLQSFKENNNADAILIAKTHEEINLLYVAITRTKNTILIPETLIPKDFPKSSQIRILKVLEEEIDSKPIIKQLDSNYVFDRIRENIGNENRFDEIREKHKDAYKPWNTDLDNELSEMFAEGVNTKDLAKHFGRTKGAINSRIKKLELRDYIE